VLKPIKGIENVLINFSRSWDIRLDITHLITSSSLSHMAEVCDCVAIHGLGIHNEKQ